MDWVAEPFQSAVAIKKESLSLLACLEAAVEAKDVQGFIEIVRGTKWSEQIESDILRAVQLSIKAGLPRVARHITTEVSRFLIGNPELQKYVRLLAPATVLPDEKEAVPDQASNIEWLKRHAKEYRGSWVALKDGQLLGVAGTLRELVRGIGDTKDVMLAPV